MLNPIIIIIEFFINMQVQGQQPHQWAPFYVTGLLHAHGRSHTRSPGVSVMRFDSQELQLSAIPVCQLLPCHLGSPRPMLSINLYVTGCLDCTLGALHMSLLPAEPSLLQDDVLDPKCQFCMKNKRNIIKLSSDENAQRVVRFKGIIA